MVKQYASCIEERLAAEGIRNISLYIDVYRSLNDRFQQRSVCIFGHLSILLLLIRSLGYIILEVV